MQSMFKSTFKRCESEKEGKVRFHQNATEISLSKLKIGKWSCQEIWRQNYGSLKGALSTEMSFVI